MSDSRPGMEGREAARREEGEGREGKGRAVISVQKATHWALARAGHCPHGIPSSPYNSPEGGQEPILMPLGVLEPSFW